MAKKLGEITLSRLEELPQAAGKIIDLAGENGKVWLFYGEMGAGKTTLIKAICEVWGITDTVSSPTFALVNEYRNPAGKIFYHFDFYRIKDEEEAWDIGTEDYFYSGNYCFVEWPERVESLLPERFIRIDVEAGIGQGRRIYISKHE